MVLFVNSTLTCVLVQIHIEVISGIIFAFSQEVRENQENHNEKDTSLIQAGHDRFASKNQTTPPKPPHITYHISIPSYF